MQEGVRCGIGEQVENIYMHRRSSPGEDEPAEENFENSWLEDCHGRVFTAIEYLDELVEWPERGCKRLNILLVHTHHIGHIRHIYCRLGVFNISHRVGNPMASPAELQSSAYQSDDGSLRQTGVSCPWPSRHDRGSVHYQIKENTLQCLKYKSTGILKTKPSAYAISVTDTGWYGVVSFLKVPSTLRA